ncbi:hypothetical protein [Polyangium aurulentum]|uniref:hypothetical protein n=1 Tax=Polyangium aurulentum TaxID=2567896 RepID=UPI0010AE714B|nr:hypothetical protein [Polyangium aurulentum]UQA56854.1 hypothetical protein E8A73_036975 [Polyangium aurulentum]
MHDCHIRKERLARLALGSAALAAGIGFTSFARANTGSDMSPDVQQTESRQAPHADPIEGPEIPEPMVFDLVRSLGARQGELEANALVQPRFRPHRAVRFEWAPEIEYAFADGHAIELELPFVNHELEAVKLALQGTIGSTPGGTMIHGWQAIGEASIHALEPDVQLTGVYLLGIDIARPVSAMVMAGGRVNLREGHTVAEAIFNPSVFARVSSNVILGLETNLAFGARSGMHTRVMPQVHLGLSDHAKLQLGAGAEVDRRGIYPAIGGRAILEL